MDLNKVKDEILKLKGKYVEMEVNKGRKKITHYEGVLEDIYASVFVVRLKDATKNDKISYSYSDVLCGDVKIEVKE
ncbi:MAG: Veg family protein [Clostridia bacterium]|nr:Veg family protein [Clostridia bacterium]